jgi:hypothetical protein
MGNNVSINEATELSLLGSPNWRTSKLVMIIITRVGNPEMAFE